MIVEVLPGPSTRALRNFLVDALLEEVLPHWEAQLDPDSGKTDSVTLPPSQQRAIGNEKQLDQRIAAKEARAKTVAKLIGELSALKPQMFEG